MGRAPCCDKASVKRGPWSPEEDAKLKDFIDKHGTGGNWIALPHKAGLKRCGKSCRLRWLNYLRPNIKHGEFSEDEDRVIYNLYASIGSRWSIIASHLPGRTDNDIKNYWNTKLRKKLLALLPSIQKKPSFFPSMPLQSPPVSDAFLNASSSFYNFNTSYLTNVSNNINSLLSSEERVNIVAKFSGCGGGGGDGGISTTTTTTNVTGIFSNPLNISNEKQYNLGFQNHNMNKEYYNYNFPEVEKMLMFGYGGGGDGGMSASGSSASSQITYNKDHHDHGFMEDHNYIDQKQKGCYKNLEEVKQLMGVNSYLMNDHDDDENKTTHIITDGFYRMIDGGN